MWKLTQASVETTASQLRSAGEAVKALKARNDLGFFQVIEREHLWTTSENRGREIRKSFHTLAVLGMGGSSLGGRALLQSLKKWNSIHQVEFVDNVDSDRFWKWLKSHNEPQGIHWLIISKSGNTIETLTMADFIDQYLRLKGLKGLKFVSTVVSETGSNPLMRWALKENVPTLEIPQDVGGRFSVLTPVGLLPAAFYGLDLGALREGAKWAFDQEELIAQLTAQSLLSFKREEWITLFWAYADGLRDFGLWIQQLWAESLGKAKNRKGAAAPRASTPIPAIGSSDQHSILQQVMEGAKDKFTWFLRVSQCENDSTTLERSLFDCQDLMQGKSMGQLFSAMASATQKAMTQEGINTLTLTTDELNERSVGAAFMLFEMVVGAVGESMNINAFDQPGVELGKRLARGILEGPK
jgi:glucose-6-phosphate isomerase